MVVAGPLRVPSGQASTGSGRTDSGSAPYDGEWGMPCPAPLWIPAFAGTTVGGVGCGGGCWWWWGEGPAAAGRAVREPPLRGLGSRGCDRGLDGVPRQAPVPSFDFPRNQQARPTSPGYCLRRNDVDGGGTPGDLDASAPRPCPGFPFWRERRWGCAGR